jgi:hypothetical protein
MARPEWMVVSAKQRELAARRCDLVGAVSLTREVVRRFLSEDQSPY